MRLFISAVFFLSSAIHTAAAQESVQALNNLSSIRVASGVNANPAVREACGITSEVETALNDGLRAGIAKAGLQVMPGRQATQVGPGYNILLPQPNDPVVPVLFMLAQVQGSRVEKEVVCAASIFVNLRAQLSGARVVSSGQALDPQMMVLWTHDDALLQAPPGFAPRLGTLGAQVAETFEAVWRKSNPAR